MKTKRKNFTKKTINETGFKQKWKCANVEGKAAGMINTFFICPIKDFDLPIFDDKYIHEADHKEEASEGGSNNLDNCQLLCHICHSVKTKFMSKRKKYFTTEQVDKHNSGPMDIEPSIKKKRKRKN